MGFLKNFFSKKILVNAPHGFPYSKSNTQNELIENLQLGVLLEDSNSFLDWNLSYAEIEKHCLKVIPSGDRTLYNFGEQRILNGLMIQLNSMKWMWTKNSVSFGSVNCELGQDFEGRKIAFEIIEHLKDQFGDPDTKDLENEEIKAAWHFGKIEIRVSSWCHFVTRYNFKLGLIKEPNWK